MLLISPGPAHQVHIKSIVKRSILSLLGVSPLRTLFHVAAINLIVRNIFLWFCDWDSRSLFQVFWKILSEIAERMPSLTSNFKNIITRWLTFNALVNKVQDFTTYHETLLEMEFPSRASLSPLIHSKQAFLVFFPFYPHRFELEPPSVTSWITDVSGIL